MQRTEAVARGLAWAFLSVPDWADPTLVTAAAETLGRRHRWLRRVVSEVLAAYHRPPLDRPDELARFLLHGTTLPEHVARAALRGRPVRIVLIPAVPGQMGNRRWPVPEVADLPALARLLELPVEQLDWAADLRGLQRRAPAGPMHLYRHHWVARAARTPRLLEAPTPLLRAVQRRILDRILCWVPLHPAAHGFVAGRSVLSNARPHVDRAAVLGMDLESFFAALTGPRVRGLFRSMGYPEAVAAALTGLCTHQTPVRVLREMPSGGDSTIRYRLRSLLAARHVPQGAPTSPSLANLACFALDRRLSGYAVACDLTYTRYADDLTFSAETIRLAPLVRAVTAIAREEGFRVNPAKTRIRYAGQRQLVTGLVTNERLSVPREDYDRLKAVLHDALVHGPEVANRAGHPDFRAHLAGRISWLEAVNPARGRRLREQLDLIAWSE